MNSIKPENVKKTFIYFWQTTYEVGLVNNASTLEKACVKANKPLVKEALIGLWLAGKFYRRGVDPYLSWEQEAARYLEAEGL